MRLIQNRSVKVGILLLTFTMAGCVGSSVNSLDTDIPSGLVITDSIPSTGWSDLPLPKGNAIYFIGESPPSATTIAAQLNIIRQGQLFLLDSLQRFYSRVQNDSANYGVFRTLPLDLTWLDNLANHEPFTGTLVTCHYKKGKIYENYSVRRQWIAKGLVQWPQHLFNDLLEERLRLAIRESNTSADRQKYQSVLLEISAQPVMLDEASQ